jgi:vancomycin permeability regulator SanA
MPGPWEFRFVSWRRLRTLGGLTLLTLLFTAFGLIADGLTNTQAPSDFALVLGNKVHPDGRLSVALQSRVDHAAKLYHDKQVQHLLVSGAMGREGHDEAVAMQHALVSLGVPATAITVDSKGWDTRASAKHAAAFATQKGFASVTVVTNYYHISRAKLACHQEGVPTVRGSAPIRFHPDNFRSVPRDVLGWWFYLLRLK